MSRVLRGAVSAAVICALVPAPASAITTCSSGWLSDLIALNSAGGCSIGGNVMSNFRLETWASQPDRHASLGANEIYVTPVNYWDDGFQWVGFRFGSSDHRFELGPNPLLPDPNVNNGFMYGYMNVHDIRFHVDAPEAHFAKARLAYEGLVGDGVSNMNMGYLVFDDARNAKPGYYHAMYSQKNFRFMGRNNKAPLAESMDHTFKVLLDDFDVRSDYYNRPPTRFNYGVTFRNNRYGHVNSNTGVDFVEYSFGYAAPLVDPDPIINPEPGTLALLAGGLGAVALAARRRRVTTS